MKALLEGRDPRRAPGLLDWVLALPLDFLGDSAFASMLKPPQLPTVPHRSISDKDAHTLGMLLGQRWIPGCPPTRPIFRPPPRGRRCQLRRGNVVQACLFRTLTSLVSIGQGFDFCESIHDCDQALEAVLSIGRNIPTLHGND